MCTVLLPSGGYPIAVNKYIISFISHQATIFKTSTHNLQFSNQQTTLTPLHSFLFCLQVFAIFHAIPNKLKHSSSSSSYVMELGHLLTRSGLTYPEVSSKICHDSFCQLGNSVSLPWVIYYEAHSIPPLRLKMSYNCPVLSCSIAKNALSTQSNGCSSKITC
jgi:hypothetical protein